MGAAFVAACEQLFGTAVGASTWFGGVMNTNKPLSIETMELVARALAAHDNSVVCTARDAGQNGQPNGPSLGFAETASALGVVAAAVHAHMKETAKLDDNGGSAKDDIQNATSVQRVQEGPASTSLRTCPMNTSSLASCQKRRGKACATER